MSTKKPAAHTASAPPSPGDPPAPKRKPGSQPGNQKAVTHGVDRAMKGTIRRTPLHGKDEYDQKALVRARRVFAGRLNDPRRSTYQENWAGKLRIKARLDLRGWFNSSGEQKEASKQFYELSARCERIESDLARDGAPSSVADSAEDAHRMAAKLVAQWPAAFSFRILAADGSDFPFGFGDGAGRPMPADPLAVDALPLPAPQAALPPAPVVVALDQRQHPSDVRAPKAAPIVESELQRRWRLGLTADGFDD